MKKCHMSFEEAHALVKSKRKCIDVFNLKKALISKNFAEKPK